MKRFWHGLSKASSEATSSPLSAHSFRLCGRVVLLIFRVSHPILLTPVSKRRHSHHDAGLGSHQTQSSLWSVSEIPDHVLPPELSKIFGIFQIVDIHIADEAKIGTEESHVHIAFGSDLSSFSGCHRLSVSRNEKLVKLSLTCTSCNPLRESEPGWGLGVWFHQTYASLLFRAAVARVKHNMAAAS